MAATPHAVRIRAVGDWLERQPAKRKRKVSQRTRPLFSSWRNPPANSPSFLERRKESCSVERFFRHLFFPECSCARRIPSGIASYLVLKRLNSGIVCAIATDLLYAERN